MSENPNNSNILSQRQQNRFESILNGRNGKFLSENTNPELGFAIKLAGVFQEFCQAKNQYLQSLEELKKYESKSLTKKFRGDQKHADLKLEVGSNFAKYAQAQTNLEYLQAEIRINYREGKVAKKAEEIQQSEISPAATQDLASWFLAQNREYPIPKEELALAQEKHEIFIEISQNLEKSREILEPEVPILKQTLSDIEKTMNNLVPTSPCLDNFGTLIYLANFLEKIKYEYNPFDGLAISGFEMESEIFENVETGNNLTLARNGHELLQILSNKSLVADFLRMVNNCETLKNENYKKQIETLKNPQKASQELSKLNQFLAKLLETLPIGIQNGSQKKLNEAEQEKLENFLAEPQEINLKVETDFIEIKTSLPYRRRIANSSIPKIEESFQNGYLFLGQDNSGLNIGNITNYLAKNFEKLQEQQNSWQAKVDNLTAEFTEISEIFVSLEIDEIGRLQVFGNLHNSKMNKSQDEVYPVKENFDILVASCHQIFLKISDLNLKKIGNKKFNAELESNHFPLLHFETPYFSGAEYKSYHSNCLSQIQDSLVFFQDLLGQKQNNLGNKLMKIGQVKINLPWQKSKEGNQEVETKEPTETQKLQNHIK